MQLWLALASNGLRSVFVARHSALAIMIPFSRMMSSSTAKADTLRVEVSDDWTQGRSLFGGLQVAIALRAMRLCAPATVLRTLQATFVAPVPPGPVHARVRVLRQGRSATHVEARLVDNDQTPAIVIGVFGAPRTSRALRMPVRPEVPGSEHAVMPFVPGLSPAFTQHFEARWLRGSFPFSGTPSSEQVVEIDMNDDGPTTEEHVVAIADLIPPIALSHLLEPAPGSTLTWMLEFLADRVDHFPLTGWRVDAELVAAHDGYTSQSVMVWAPDGTPAALSRQSMLVFG